MAKSPPAEQVLVSRWYCTWGTRVCVVAAETRDDARAIVSVRLGIDRWAQVRVRCLSVDDEERLAAIEAHAAALRDECATLIP